MNYKVIQLIKLILILPIFFYDFAKVIFISRLKKYIYLYHFGWGVGLTVHDTDMIRNIHQNNSALLVFFNDGKHNYYLRNSFDNISLRFIRIFILNPLNRKTIKLDKYYSMKLYDLSYTFIKNINPQTIIQSPEEYRRKFEETIVNEGVLMYHNDMYHYDNYFNYKIRGITLPKNKSDLVDKKLVKYFDSESKIIKDKLVCFYLRYKGSDPNCPDEYTRNTSLWSLYLKTFRHLKKNGYLLLLYGDYNYGEIENDAKDLQIACAENLSVNQKLFSLYASINCSYFIGCCGGGLAFPLARINPPKILILNALPFSFAIPNATVVYKNLRDSSGELLPAQILLNKYKMTYMLNGYQLEDNDENIIFNSVNEFIEMHSKKNLMPIVYPDWLPNSSYLRKFHARISPVWIASNTN